MKKTLGGGIILILALIIPTRAESSSSRSQKPRSIRITGLYNNGDIS